MAVAKLIKDTRTKLGLTQREMADSIAISIGYYRQIENGDRKPGKALSLKIADKYGLSLRELIQ